MVDKEEEYNGFWMKLGCLLSAAALLGIFVVLLLMAYNFLAKN